MPTQEQFIDDPFSLDFIEKAEKQMEIIQVSARSINKKVTNRRIKRDKFVIHSDLKKRLLKLHNTDVDPIVKEMVMRILTMKYIPVEGKYCNYLGLSQADFSKISYLDYDRKNRLEGQTTSQHIIKPGTQIILFRKRSYVREGMNPIYKETLTLNSRHLNDLVYPIREFVPTVRNYSYRFYSNNIESAYGLNTPAEMISEEITVNIPHLEEDSAEFRVHHSRMINRNEIVLGPQGIISVSTHNLIGVEFKNTETNLKEVWNYKQRYHTSIGKIIKRLFAHEFSDNDITKFAEAYSGLITVSNPYYDFSIVDEERIRWAYHENNYYAHSNNLGNSCMRYSRCQSYFDMYVNFPDIIKLAILTRANKVAARCLVWKTEDGWLYDRIYSSKLETEQLLKSTLEAHNYTKIYCQHSKPLTFEMNLDEIQYFPYMDTFSYYFPEDRILSNHVYKDGEKYFELRSTGGHYEIQNGNRLDEIQEVCECCGHEMQDEDVFRANAGLHNGYALCGDCEVFSEHMNVSFSTADSYVSTYDEDRVLRESAIQLYNNSFAYENDEQLSQFENGYGWFIRDIHPHYDFATGYYHISDPLRIGILRNCFVGENLVENLVENMVEDNDTNTENFTIII